MVKALLPPGSYDLLPPYARQETELLTRLLSTFEAYGYAQVAPPLMEYTESLLAGRGATLSGQVFRLMDPGFHKVMGIRADITLQIARIAATRLAAEPLPLRLSYAGPVLRMLGDTARGSRQLTQAGIELIGPSSAEADVEVILVAADALTRAGIGNFVIDLNVPGIVGQLLANEALEEIALEQLLQAIAHKDVSAIEASALAQKETLSQVMTAAGPAQAALTALKRLALPHDALTQVGLLEQVVRRLEEALPGGVSITIDPTEARGLEYHTGVTFSFFASGSAQELGCGGRYRIDREDGRREATGFTLYVNALRRLLPEPAPGKRVFMASYADYGTVTALQQEGFTTVHALPDYGDTREDALALGCTHYFSQGLEEL